MKVLYSSNDIHSHIKRVLSEPAPGERRVVIAAYVGKDAASYLPNPEGLTLVCSLTPLATNAEALRELELRGAKIMKSERLHMKVYWSNLKGCVIGSANVSSNALGKGAAGLKEAGVFLDPGEVDIEMLLDAAGPQPISSKDLEKLQKRSDVEAAALGGLRQAERSVAGNKTTFIQWCDKYRDIRRWKMSWYKDINLGVAEVAKQELRNRYGSYEPAWWINVDSEVVEPSDWILTFDLSDLRKVHWMYTDLVVKVPKSDRTAYERGFPYQALQARPISKYPEPPFTLDKHFKKAIALLVEQIGPDGITLKPTAGQIQALIKGYRSSSPTAP